MGNRSFLCLMCCIGSWQHRDKFLQPRFEIEVIIWSNLRPYQILTKNKTTVSNLKRDDTTDHFLRSSRVSLTFSVRLEQTHQCISTSRVSAAFVRRRGWPYCSVLTPRVCSETKPSWRDTIHTAIMSPLWSKAPCGPLPQDTQSGETSFTFSTAFLWGSSDVNEILAGTEAWWLFCGLGDKTTDFLGRYCLCEQLTVE